MVGVTWDAMWDETGIDWTRLREQRHHFEIVDELHARGLVLLPSEAHRRHFAELTGSVLAACGPHTLPMFRKAVAYALSKARCGPGGAVYLTPLSTVDVNTHSPHRIRATHKCK